MGSLVLGVVSEAREQLKLFFLEGLGLVLKLTGEGTFNDDVSDSEVVEYGWGVVELE